MAQLQAQVSFDQIAAKPEYINAPSDVQRDVALRYFDDNYATKPEFQKAPLEVQNDARQRFFQDYKVPGVQSTPRSAPQPVRVQQGFTAPAPGIAAFNPETTAKLNQYNQGQLSGLSALVKGATLGYADPYNPNMGQQAEAIRGIPENIGSFLPFELTGAGVDKLAPSLGDTLLGRVVRDAGSFGLIGGLQSQPGDQLNMGARALSAGAGALQGAAFPLIGAGFERMSQGLSRLIPALKAKGGRQLPIGMSKYGPVYKRTVSAPDAAYGDFGRSVATRSAKQVIPHGQRLLQQTERFIQDAQNFQGIDTKATAQMKARAYKQAYDALQARAQASGQTMRGKIGQAQSRLQREFEGQKPTKPSVSSGTDRFNAVVDYIQELRKAGRIKEADQALGQYRPETKARIYDEVKRREAAIKKQAVQAERDYKAEYRKLLAEEKAAQKRQKALETEARKTQNQKEKQAIKDRIALERAESKNRQRELRQLQGEIKGRIDEQKRQAQQQKGQQPAQGTKAKQENPSGGETKREKVTPGPRAASRQAIKAEASQAAQSGELVEFDYSAEGGRSRVNEERIVQSGTAKDGRTEARQVGGESLDKRQGYRKEVVLETGVTKAGDDFMRTMDADGNISTRIISGKGQKSKVNWLRRTGEKPPEGFGAGGGSRVEMAYSSDIKASVKKMESVLERIKKGEAVTSGEIMEAAKLTDEKAFMKETEGLDSAKIAEICKKVTE